MYITEDFNHCAAVTDYLIKFRCIKATIMNLAESQAHCSSANEIKAIFAFLPAFNYSSGRTARARRLNEERGEQEQGYMRTCTNLDSFSNEDNFWGIQQIQNTRVMNMVLFIISLYFENDR